jgi:cbb3-type cytochrome oxidase subunit 3
MFKRLIVEEWQRLLAISSFAIFFLCFLINALRVMRMPHRQIEEIETLPLADDAHDTTTH